MRSDFLFVLHCAKCGLNGEIEEYTLRYQCPECGSEMRLSRIKTNISGEPLRNRLRELLAKKERGDKNSGRIFAMLADSPDPEVRKLLDEVLEEKYCRDHGIATSRPAVQLEPEVSSRSDEAETVTTYTGPRTDLTSVTIPEGVTIIGKDAFAYCRSLTNVTIPESVTTIETGAFEGCAKLTSVTIPPGVKTISDGAFRGCGKVEVLPGNRNFYTDASGALIDRGNGRLLFFPPRFSGAYTIPSGVKTIADHAFAGCSGLTSVTIPPGVKTIGKSAFHGCEKLTGAALPSSVTSIGYGAFEGCAKLTSVTIPPGVKTISDGAFRGCGKVEVLPGNRNFYTDASGALIDRGNGRLLFFPPRFSGAYTIPSGVTTIGNRAFAECEKLTDVTIPSSVKTIGAGAFHGCLCLASVTIPEGVTTIGDYAFEGCEKLRRVTAPASWWNIFKAFRFRDMTSVTIPSSVKTIGREAFRGCPCEKSVKKQFPRYR